MIYTKVIGWLVFSVGLVLIGWTLFNSYAIFTAKTLPPSFFTVPQETLSQAGGTLDIQEQLKNMIGEQLKSFIPEGSITNMLNLAVWSVLAGLLMYGGAQIAGLGIKLIK